MLERAARCDFNSCFLRLLTPAEAVAATKEYACDPQTGESFCGTQEGDWRESWLVIGATDRDADPVFIDTAQVGPDGTCPVFYAFHGDGYWDPEIIAPSLDALLGYMKLIDDLDEADLSDEALERLAEQVGLVIRADGNEIWESIWLRFFEPPAEEEDRAEAGKRVARGWIATLIVICSILLGIYLVVRLCIYLFA